jgi:hypothetical protein
MTTTEDRKAIEKTEHEMLEMEGFKINFGDPANVRDNLEQTAAKLECRDPSQKKAVSEYLEALQQPNVTPSQLIVDTNKLRDKFGADLKDSNNPNFDNLHDMHWMSNGVADHFNLSRYGNTQSREIAFTKMESNGISAPPPSGPK